jgi:hypothetical protein
MKKKRVGKAVAVFAVIASLALMPWIAKSQMMGGGGEGMSSETSDAVGKMMNEFNKVLQHRFTPVVKNVTVGKAVAGKPIPVTVSAGYDDKRAIDKVSEVAIYYSIDGGATFNGPVNLKPQSGGKWAGQIPAIAKKGKVIYYPRIRDSYGNVTVHIPCNVASWPPEDDGCMVSGAVDREPVDDPKSLVEDNFDLWEMYVGMDSKYIYLDQNYEGKVSKGTMNPLHVNAYLSLVVDTKELYDFNDISMFMGGGGKSEAEKEKLKKKADKAAMIWYAPLASKALASATAQTKTKTPKDKDANATKDGATKGDAAAAKPAQPLKLPPCGMPRLGPDGKMMLDDKSVTCKALDTDLYIKVDRGVLNASMKNDFTVIGAIDGFISSFETPVPTFRDFACFTRVVFQQHSFVVK